MNKYKIFKVLNAEGTIITSKKDYKSFNFAKKGASAAIHRLEKGCKIVEYEITETPIEETIINITTESEEYTTWFGSTCTRIKTKIVGYGEKNTEIIEQNILDKKISFNN